MEDRTREDILPLLKSIDSDKADYIMWEIHEEMCVHPQANGLVEAVNKNIKRNLKAKLEGLKRLWPKMLLNVSWVYRMNSQTSTGETAFLLAFGEEALMPVEIKIPSHRVELFNLAKSDEALRLNLDLLEEHRKIANLPVAEYKS
ncbi:uncharacterized protein LOC120089065 [Benincasa hispida]|uniref:uncharacterized protein LOC120089065 n=1 Tax=Benincasa hispida TaxID=102211 RepID=UPI0018FF3211|nr:uncharacterized protein LOC120089065 [Benincasa hispida]